MSADNCFNLAGDGDDVDVLEAVERAFGVKISDAESEDCETFGQLFDVVWAKVRRPNQIVLKCPSAIAFYRLRAGLRKFGFEGKITLATDLKAFFRKRGAKQLRKKLAEEVGLELPHLSLTALSAAVLACISVVGLVASVTQSSWLPILATVILAAGVAFIVPRELPHTVASMRDFTSACTAWNYGLLARESGGARSHDLWHALAIVVRETCGTGFNGSIDRGTRFFPSRT